MIKNAQNIQKSKIPIYALYGDHSPSSGDITYNFEWIPQRSSIYNRNIPPHLHEAFIQLLLITEGSGKALIDNKWWHIRAPALILVPAHYVHGFQWEADINGPVITAAQRPLESLSKLLYPELLQTIRTPKALNLPKKSPYLEQLMPLLLLIEQESRMTETGQSALSLSLITAVLIQISRITAKESQKDTSSSLDLRKNDLLQQFRSLIDQWFKKHKPLNDYADHLGITSGHLARICREELGITALKMIQSRLIHEAKRDLIYTNSSIRQIAHSLGFQDEAYFSRFFKRHTEQNPNVFRQIARLELQSPTLNESKLDK